MRICVTIAVEGGAPPLEANPGAGRSLYPDNHGYPVAGLNNGDDEKSLHRFFLLSSGS